ncbi:hypothetical protein [Paenibacillus hexagrammi]|nr:hypothetical protein [Paenibacillus sp. YPD9-1]
MNTQKRIISLEMVILQLGISLHEFDEWKSRNLTVSDYRVLER